MSAHEDRVRCSVSSLLPSPFYRLSHAAADYNSTGADETPTQRIDVLSFFQWRAWIEQYVCSTLNTQRIDISPAKYCSKCFLATYLCAFFVGVTGKIAATLFCFLDPTGGPKKEADVKLKSSSVENMDRAVCFVQIAV